MIQLLKQFKKEEINNENKGTKMKIIKYFVIMAEKDQCEGRGGLEETGIHFSNNTDALSFTKTKEMQKYTVMGHVRPEGHK